MRISPHQGVRLAGMLLGLAAMAAYHNSFGGPFIWDDSFSILNNPTIRHLGSLSEVFSPPYNTTVNNRPFLNLTFALNYALSGTDVWSYHALNLLIHMLAGLTLFGAIRRTLLQPLLRERFSGAALPVAFVAALLWLVHPLQTQAITYVVQRAESLMGLFFLLTLYGFIRGTEEGGARGWFFLSFVACFLGMETKEVVAIAPLMVVLYDRTFVSGTFREAWRRHWRVHVCLAGTWLLQWHLLVNLGRRDPTSGFGSVPWRDYALTQFQAVAHYLQLVIWPYPLIFYRESVWVNHVAEVAPYALIIVPLVVLTVLAMRHRPVVGFLGAWFFAILAPTSVVPGGCEPMAERRMYLPLAAVIILIVAATYAWAGRRSLIVFLAAAVALGAVTIRRNEAYRSDLAIWSDTVAKCPEDAIDHYMLGSALMGKGQWPEAIREFDETLRRRPDLPEARISMGLVLMAVKNYTAAIPQLQEALRLRPRDTMVRNSLGIALVRVGMITEGLEQFRQALLLDHNFAAAENNLGAALLRLGRSGEAREHFERALQIDPGFSLARQHLNELGTRQTQP